MITASDKEYKYTKLLKQGKASMNPDFDSLAEWIYKTYGSRPINIIYDTISGAGGKLIPRLEIIFEFLNEKIKFQDQSGYNYDKLKQEQIKEQFKKDIISKGFTLNKSFWNLFGRRVFAKYDAENMFVIFSAFESIAKAEANDT